MLPVDPNLSATYVRSILSYNKRTGVLRWKVNRRPRAKKGKEAGCRAPNGYIHVGIDGSMYLAHRLAWLIVTGAFPKEQLDHRDLDPSNNKWKNLREATHAQNKRNQTVNKNNACGIKGVHKRNDCNRWTAMIQCAKKVHYLGLFKTKMEAAASYKAAAKKFHKEFANG